MINSPGYFTSMPFLIQCVAQCREHSFRKSLDACPFPTDSFRYRFTYFFTSKCSDVSIEEVLLSMFRLVSKEQLALLLVILVKWKIAKEDILGHDYM